jgi:hypothetical protein
MRKQKVSEPTEKWTVLVAANGREVLKHTCTKCRNTVLIPSDVQPKSAFCCGRILEAPQDGWLNRIEREQAPTYSMPILPMPHFDRSAV